MQCIQRAISIYPTSWECRVPQDRRRYFKSDHSTLSAQITDQSLISHINTTTLSSKQVRRINNHQLSDTILIYQQILRTDTKRTVWITVMRINIMNMELKESRTYFELSSLCILFDSRIWRFLSLSSFSNSNWRSVSSWWQVKSQHCMNAR